MNTKEQLLNRIYKANELLECAIQEFFYEVCTCMDELETNYDHEIGWLDDVACYASKTENEIDYLLRRHGLKPMPKNGGKLTKKPNK
jgi:hypothetical protein